MHLLWENYFSKTKGEKKHVSKLSPTNKFVHLTSDSMRTIKIKSIPHHGFFLRYRLATSDLDMIPVSLRNFLWSIFDFIPLYLFDHPDNPGCSGMRIHLDVDTEKISNHPICVLAKRSKEHIKFKSRHENLQQWFLLNDSKSVVAELPVWADRKELAGMSLKFGFPLTGHIDLVRYNEELIEIWDYKPRASKEKWAHVQTWLYAIVLSIRTGITLNQIMCGWFDEEDAFVFRLSNSGVKLH